MNSRYARTKNPLAAAAAEDTLLEDDGTRPHKAKCRHVMQGFSEEAAAEGDSDPGTGLHGLGSRVSGFHSGLPLRRRYRARVILLPAIPGAHPNQLLRLLKTCYGLTDGPLAWYRHLSRRLVQDFGYVRSLADPCVFLLHSEGGRDGPLDGIVGVATDDLLHGGTTRQSS